MADELLSLEETLCVGGTYVIPFEITVLNTSGREVVLDLTGATITVTFKDPTGNTHSQSGTVTSTSLGLCQYTTVTTDLDEDGDWVLQVVVTIGGTVLPSLPIRFKVRSLAAA